MAAIHAGEGSRRWNVEWLNPVSKIVDSVALGGYDGAGYKPGKIVPRSRIYTITHDPARADMPHQVT
jgi:hypothetical protein